MANRALTSLPNKPVLGWRSMGFTSRYKPTSEQEAILSHSPERHARVFAGPGTGKSATVVALIDKLLVGKSPPRIKLLTFTRAATGELAKKVSSHPATVTERPSTIHSFAISALLRNPGVGEFPQPLRIADDWEEDKIIYPTLARRIGVQKRRLRDLFLELAANWESLSPVKSPRVDPRDRARFLGGWQEHREVFGYTLLSELPYSLMHALQNHPDLDGVDYDLLIVDEYQDLNACDLAVLKLIADRGCSIIAAGDDDQSIYSFRRAAPEGIRRFTTDYPVCSDYSLSITHRCGRRIMDWATFVIQGDPSRPIVKPSLKCDPKSPIGEAALLSFPSERCEARGVALLVNKLIDREHISPPDILVLLRGDHNGMFSDPIKKEMENLGVPYSDPELCKKILGDSNNRRLLAILRLLVHQTDSLAWATLLELWAGIGDAFFDHIYSLSMVNRKQFGEMLLEAQKDKYSGAGLKSAQRASELVESVLDWIGEHPLPKKVTDGWGNWIQDVSGSGPLPKPSDQLTEILSSLDKMVETDQGLGRYLS